MVWAIGCLTPARQEIDTDIVRSIRFEGNGGFLSGQTDYQLASQMAQGDTAFGLLTWPLMYFVEPAPLDTALLQDDAYRLEVWYAHNGWFDASVEGWRVHRIRRAKSFRAGVVDVVGQVDPGPPSLVRGFEINGLSKAASLLGNDVKRTGYLQPGDQFALENVYASRDALLASLRDTSYAYAQVGVKVDAYPDERAVDVVFDVDAGPSSVYGPITIRGNKRVKRKIIRDTLPFESGDTYDASELSRAQSELFELGTFSVVAVAPDLDDPTVDEVPIKVSVTESRFRRLRLGGGVAWDVQTLTPRVTAEYRQLNILQRLIRFDAAATGGFAYSTDSSGVGGVGLPIYDLSAGVSWPRFIVPPLTWSITGKLDQDLFSGQFPSRNPSVGSSLSWEVSDKVVLQTGVSWEQFSLVELTDAATQAAQATFGAGFQDQYRLTTAELRFSYKDRDDPLQTQDGEDYTVALRQSIPTASGDFLFSEASLDLRAWRPLRLGSTRDIPWTIAGRMQAKVMQPWGGSELPYPELGFLGGGSSMRGFRLNQVGAYTCLCTYDGIPGTEGVSAVQHYLPVGGAMLGAVSTELRYEWAYDIVFAWFFDVAALARDPADLALSSTRVGGGLGARYNSLVGPIRLDLGLRPLYPEDDGPTEFVRCASAEDQVARAYDLFSQPVGARGIRANRAVPFAVNVFFAIGESF